jgi:very-short-patch-repair endonuclease
VKLKLIERFALAHHGVITLDAVRDAGMSRSTWQRAVASGQLELIHEGVARIAGAAIPAHQPLAAAVLAAGKGALASHRAAAWLWGIPLPNRPVPELILPSRARQATLEGVIVHRPRDLLDLGAVYKYGIPACKLLRIACDYGAVDPQGAHAVIGHIITNGWMSAEAFEAAVRTHGRRGRPGVPVLRAALADWTADGKALDSELERLMTRLVRRFKLPPVEFHPIVLGYEIDFRVVGSMVLLECDGWEWHDKRRTNFERDRKRRAELVAAGYVVVPFTWNMLKRQPQWVASMIRTAVARWNPIWAASVSEAATQATQIEQ